MNTQRIEMLKKAILEEPGDPVYKYGLALEYLHSQRTEAKKLFDELLVVHVDYLPAYYQAGMLFIDDGEEEKGKRILEAGIALARAKGEQKTMNELMNLLDSVN